MDVQHDQLNPEVQKSPTYEELVQLVVELRAVIKAQAETIRLQAEEIKLLKKKLYGSSSEKRSASEDEANKDVKGVNGPPISGSGTPIDKGKKTKRNRTLSEQYPNAEVKEEILGFDHIPMCACCNEPMVDAGLEEVSEQVHTIPAKHIIIRKRRRKFRCRKGLSGLVSAPLAPRIAPGSSLADSFIMWAALSKFLYLNPSER